MGTSSSYTAPTTGRWPEAKAAATRFASQHGQGSTTPHDLTSTYVGAVGGAVAAAARAIAGKRTAAQLGSFLGRAAEVGLDEALRESGLENLIGREPLAVLAGLVDLLAGPAETPEESVDRDALLAVFEAELLQAATYEELELLLMGSLDAAGIVRLLQLFLVEYVYRRIRQELGKQLEEGARSPGDLPGIEQDIRAYIIQAVGLELQTVDVLRLDWQGSEATALIETVFRSAYEQIA